MSTPISITIDNPDPNSAPTTFSALIAILRTLIHAVLPGTFLVYVVSSTTPATDDQDKVWVKITSGGAPVGEFKYFGGAWRRIWSVGLGAVQYFNGNPATYFDSDGLGIVGGLWDGWQLLSGGNGSLNMTDKFICSAHMDGSGGIPAYSSGWRTVHNTLTQNTGGSDSITLTAATTYRAGVSEFQASYWMADGNAQDDGSGLLGRPTGTAFDIVPAVAANTTPDAIPIMPKYVAMAPAQYVGY